jgi:hypothetical protein
LDDVHSDEPDLELTAKFKLIAKLALHRITKIDASCGFDSAFPQMSFVRMGCVQNGFAEIPPFFI